VKHGQARIYSGRPVSKRSDRSGRIIEISVYIYINPALRQFEQLVIKSTTTEIEATIFVQH